MPGRTKTTEERIEILERAADEFSKRLLKLSRELADLRKTEKPASVAVSGMKTPELRAVGAAMGIEDSATMKREDLIARIEAAKAIEQA